MLLGDAEPEIPRVMVTLVDACAVADREAKRVKLPVLYADDRAEKDAWAVGDREPRPELCACAECDVLRVADLVITAVPVPRALVDGDAVSEKDRFPVALRTAGRVALTEGVTASE